jgi:4-hydroxy 2-oxovalerate aldolase
MTRVAITDVTLRDGSHAMGHQFTVDQVTATVAALEKAGVRSLEIAHGDGLGGSSFNYGFSGTNELELIRAAVATANEATIACLLLPGVGTAEMIHEVAEIGARTLRVATHSTEADIAIQHIATARELGLDTVGFLMLSHMTAPGELARQARIMAEAGANCVYVVDSAGALLPDHAAERVAALRAALPDDVEVGFHGHNNLAMGVADSLRAVEAGATRIDGALAALGAGAGNSPTEVLAAVFERAGIETGVDVVAALDAAENVVRPYMRHEPRMDFGSVVLGYAGVYSSFLLHAQRAGERYGVPMQDILLEAGRRHLVGGQEDVMIEIAVALAGSRRAAAPAA